MVNSTKELDQEIGYRTVVRWLHDKGFRLKVPRSWPDGQDEEKRRIFFVEQLQGYLSDPDIDSLGILMKPGSKEILDLAGAGQKRVKRSDFLIKALISG